MISRLSTFKDDLQCYIQLDKNNYFFSSSNKKLVCGTIYPKSFFEDLESPLRSPRHNQNKKSPQDSSVIYMPSFSLIQSTVLAE